MTTAQGDSDGAVPEPASAGPPVYRGDLEHRGEYQDIVPKSFWTGFTDTAFFIFAGVASLVLTIMLLTSSFTHSWWGLLLALVFWGFTAYLTLPRFHAIMSRIYVPDYFIGRTRTSDGLLGDPVNLGLIGTEEQIHQAMLNAGWTRADEVTLASSWKIVVSTLTRRSYAEAPVSPLKIFGRVQSFAYQQEVDGNPEKRHHVRFWKTPDGWLLPGGHRVDWLAAGTYDSGVGFSFFTLQVTHRIDAQTDFERDYIVESIQYAYPQTEVEVIKDFSTGYHARNGGGDTIVTDGALPIVTLRNEGLERQDAEARDVRLTSAHDIAEKLPIVLLTASLMLVISSVAELVTSILTVANRHELVSNLTGQGSDTAMVQVLNGPEGDTFMIFTLVAAIAVVVIFESIHMFMLWATLRGSSKARRMVLLLLVVGFAAQVASVFAAGEALTISSLFFQLGVAVFAMLGFTSDAAVDYTASRNFRLRNLEKIREKVRRQAIHQ